MAVAIGHGYTLIVTEDGNICASGNNQHGQLGIGDFEPHDQSYLLKYVDTFGGHEVVMVAAEAMNCMSACVTKDGSLWTWGDSRCGALVHPQLFVLGDDLQCRPRRVPASLHGNSPVVMVAFGGQFLLILTISGHIWSLGEGMFFELGHGSCNQLWVPKRINPAVFDNAEIGMIAAGCNHCLALSKTDGRVWSWGNNSKGQTGVDNEFVDETTRCVQNPTLIPAAVLEGGSVVFVSCGSDFSALVTADGVVWMCGNNRQNEIGLGDNIARSHVFRRVGGAEFFGSGIRMVSCGMSHSMILANDNSVWTCGNGRNGELARASNTDAEDEGMRGRPRRIDDSTFHRSVTRGMHDNDVVVVAAGVHCSFAITYAGVLYGWGARPSTYFHDIEEELHQPIWASYKVAARTLGYADNSEEYARAGRWHYIHHDAMIAFIMGTQPGFAVNTPRPSNSMFPRDMLEQLFGAMRFAPREATSHGVRTCLGIGDA